MAEYWETWDHWNQAKIDKTWIGKINPKNRDKMRVLTAKLCVEKGDSVIDIACGGGIEALCIRELSNKVNYTGIDINSKMLKTAKKVCPGAEFIQGDAGNLPFPDQSFDVSMIRHLLEHHPIEKATRILHEALRIMRKAALIVFFHPLLDKTLGKSVIEKWDKKNKLWKNTYSKTWFFERIINQIDDPKIKIFFLPKKKNPLANTDQELYLIERI